MSEKKFDIESHFVAGIEVMYDNLISNGINIVYIGRFSHSIIKMFGSMAEEDMENGSLDSTTRKRVYHAIIEILQNMSKHSDEISDEKQVGRGLFMIGKKSNKYFIITSNKIKLSQVSKVEDSLLELNNASHEELNEMYYKQLKDGRLSSKGGAGLGLIDIARKTNKKLLYNFIPNDKEYAYFIMKVTIDKK